MGIKISLKRVLIEEAVKTYTITEKLFRKVKDDELSWKPSTGKNWMTVGQLLMHCSCFGCGKAVQGFVTGDWGISMKDDDSEAIQHMPPAEAMPSVKNVEQALKLLEEDRELTLSCLHQVKEGNLLSSRPVAPWGGAELTLFQQLMLMIAHLTQHKGQLFYYLKLMGKDVDTHDLWGS